MTHRIAIMRLILRVASKLAIALAFAGLVPSALALSLGGEQVTSSLGQPLRMTVPLLGSTADSLDTRCFRVVTPSRSDGLSVVTQARIELQSNTNPPQLIIRSGRSIDEPVIRISIEAGCDAPIRRDYTILLDPPLVQLPEPRVASAAAPPALPIAAEGVSTRAPVSALSASDKAVIAAARTASRRAEKAAAAKIANGGKSATQTASVAREKPAQALATAKQIQQDKLEVQGGSPLGVTSPAEIASLSALAVPRLRIASDLAFLAPPGNQPGAAPVDELQAAIAKDRRARLLAAPIESDLAPRLEADLVVAQRRLVELQSQLAAAGLVAKSDASAAPGLPSKVERPAATAAASSSGGWDWQRWVWVPGLLMVAGLVGFLLRQRRSQATRQFAAAASEQSDHVVPDEEITVVRAIPTRDQDEHEPGAANFDSVTASPVVPTGPVTPITDIRQSRSKGAANPIIATRDEREASDRLNNPLFQLRDTESHVDVTELSQVTDEAQVYADLGRNDQAIEILRDHIDSQTGELTSPAPWLMIFELYRRTNNRQGYDELAPQFRKNFNGRVPEWDNYGHELALDDGLEAFPHLVARIERDWGTGEARKFLEELLYDNRGGSRLGFSLAAYRDILLLLQVHEGLNAQPDFLAAATDWESRGADDSDGTPKWDLSLEMIEPPKTGELESFFNRPPPDKI